MNIISDLLKNISKIAKHDPTIIEDLSRNIAKLAEYDSTIIIDICKKITIISEKYPHKLNAVVDSISSGQIESKLWIGENLKNVDMGNIFLCCGWFATLLLLNKSLKYKKCISIDIDPECRPISILFNKNLVINDWKFQAVTKDINQINYNLEKFSIMRNDNSITELTIIPDTIINTSCEHIENFSNWYNLLPKKKLIILQTNNAFNISGHINCVTSLEEFEKQTPMYEVIYSGEKKLPKFTRYMRIGYC